MKKILLTLISIYMIFISYSQLPYSWPSGSDPGWTTDGNGLQWRNACSAVTTNCTGNYNNNMNTTYTSPSINATCNNASTISITFTASGNAELGWDFLFVEYSLNNGITWINPYGAGVGWTANFGAGYTIPAIILSSTNNIRFRFRFTSDFIYVYNGYKLLDFDIVCNVVLPIELLTFNGINQNNINILTWSTASEDNNDYFTLERSEDGEKWEEIKQIDGAGNSQEELHYSCVDNTYKNVINYYRLSQTDNDGSKKYFDPIAINNIINKKEILKVVNSLGQIVDINTKGVLFIIYTDGKIERIVNY